MVNTTIYVDVSEIKRRLGLLADESGKVIARAVNRSYPTGKSAIAKGASGEYLITQKEVNSPKTLKIIKARPSKPVATLEYTGGHRNLYLWNNKKAVSPNKVIHWPDGPDGKPNVRTYRASVAKGHAKVPLLGRNKPFIQRVRTGENSEFVGLFRRATEKRDSKLVGVGAPSIPQILKNGKVMEQFRRSAGPMLQKRLEHEIDAILKGVTK